MPQAATRGEQTERQKRAQVAGFSSEGWPASSRNGGRHQIGIGGRIGSEFAADYAQVLKELSDVHFPDAEKIVLVQDNLSTHTAASLYAAFPAPEARRLAKRFEWHYTPKHGSWLDMAESELGVLLSQCLDRRIPDKLTLQKEAAAWQDHRNKHNAKADWQFTTHDARVKLKRLYPTMSDSGD